MHFHLELVFLSDKIIFLEKRFIFYFILSKFVENNNLENYSSQIFGYMYYVDIILCNSPHLYFIEGKTNLYSFP